jgi:DNA polymerase-3 subunit alpha (Gram-positive type)
LVQISGLSHGTDVWNNNAQELINNKTCKLMNVIGCRDDIMVELIKMGLEPSMAFKIMESVRKGKGLSPEFEEAMISHNVPDWYIASCKKIKYMFPKAHAVAYVTMAMRVAWYKVYRPLEYYAVYFTTRCDAYDIETMIQGKDAIKAKFLDIQARKANYATARDVTNKEESLLITLESAIEMTARGFKFSNIDLYKSDAKKFVVDHETNSLIPPFSSIDGLGEAAAKTVIEARKNGEFLSIEDLTMRTQLNGTNIKMLEKLGVLKDMQPRNQLELSLF